MNNLLLNFSNPVNFDSTNTNTRARRLNPNIQKIKDLQKVREYEKINKLEQTIDSKKLVDMIIKPEKVDKVNFDEKVYESRKLDQNNLEKYWSQRTNMPYKNILKDENYSKEIKDERDLVIHMVTHKDKLGVEEKYKEIKNNIREHNQELCKIYSTTEEGNHKRKFEYNHRYKDKKKYNPSSHKEMKDTKMNDITKAEPSIDKEVIVSELVSNGIFNEDELKMFGLL